MSECMHVIHTTMMMRWMATVMVVAVMASGSGGVSMDYYMMSCQMAEMTVRDAVREAVRGDPSLAAGLLRMHFHDCFVEGCDASVLIDSTGENKAEKESPANLSLRGFEVIDEAKERVERACPGVVSCADILAMAARDAVFFSGGPFYAVPTGRFDGARSRIEDTRALPPPFLNATQLVALFGSHGLSPRDTVALSGAHTLGTASCAAFQDRLDQLPRIACPADQPARRHPFDASTNDFDNAYFDALMRGNGLLTSDHALYAWPGTRRTVAAYAQNQAMFFYDFQQAMRKMGLISLKDSSQGNIRSHCRRP